MQARMGQPAVLIPAAMKGLATYGKAAEGLGVPKSTLGLVHVRASQINGCSVCLELHAADLQTGTEKPERLLAVAAWRESPHFSDAERAALALTEAVTRIADSSAPVPDDVWAEAARHYDEQGLAALLICITAANTWNRLNVATRQVAGQWTP